MRDDEKDLKNRPKIFFATKFYKKSTDFGWWSNF